MNFLYGGCVIRYSGLPYRRYVCYKDRLASARQVKLDVIEGGLTPWRRKKSVKHFEEAKCFGKHHVSSLTSWTQVRFNKDFPKFHRDLPFPNFDAYRKEDHKDVTKTYWGLGIEKTGFTYVVGFFGLLCGSYALKSELTHYITYMGTATDVLAMASIEVDLSNIAPGACLSYKWRGKPLFIKHRTQADIDSEAKTPMSALRDPQTPEQRTTNPEWLIVIGVCTHLGCVPIPNSGDWAGGFYCPCHGSHYDNVGRTRKGPAPLNLEVPLYTFLSDTLVLVG